MGPLIVTESPAPSMICLSRLSMGLRSQLPRQCANASATLSMQPFDLKHGHGLVGDAGSPPPTQVQTSFGQVHGF
jgi:hypothetical protein